MKSELRTMTIAQITSAAATQLINNGYSENYRATITGIYNKFSKYCLAKGELTYSTALGQQFFTECYPSSRVREDRRNVVDRAMQILADIFEFGTLVIRRRQERQFPKQFSEDCAAYLKKLQLKGVAKIPSRVKLIRFTT